MSGQLAYRGEGFLVVEANGFGYKIVFPVGIEEKTGSSVTVYLHEVIRESERELFGFRSMDELELFWKLIAISGVGPRIAQKIVFQHPVETIRSQIMLGNLSFLTEIPGIGKKIAQKIILELKGVLTDDSEHVMINEEALHALIALGYHRKDAEDAIRSIEAQEDTEACIRAALKTLSV